MIDARNPDFPSGAMQRKRRFGVEARGLLTRFGAEGLLRIDAHYLSDIDHEPGLDGDLLVAELGIRVRHDFTSRTR